MTALVELKDAPKTWHHFTTAKNRDILAALNLLAIAIPKRPTNAAFVDVLFRQQREKLTLSAFDGITSITIQIPCRDARGTGSFNLPWSLLRSFLNRTQKLADISFSRQQRAGEWTGLVEVTTTDRLNANFHLRGMPNYPQLPVAIAPECLTLPADELRDAIAPIMGSASNAPDYLKQDPCLKGINLRSAGDGNLILSATDKKQISQSCIECSEGIHLNETLPRLVFQPLHQILKLKLADMAELALQAGRAFVTYSKTPEMGIHSPWRITISTPLLEGLYPLIPNLSEVWTVQVDRKALMSQLEIAIACSGWMKDRHYQVRLDANPITQSLTLSSEWEGNGKKQVAMQVDCPAEQVLRHSYVWVNAQRLYRTIKKTPSRSIRLGLSAPLWENSIPGIVITTPDNLTVHAIAALQTESDLKPTDPIASYSVELPALTAGMGLLMRPLACQHPITLQSVKTGAIFTLQAANCVIEALRDRQQEDGTVQLTKAEALALYRQRQRT